ncbi:hypothetical protein N8510_03495, partial [bacterium]|nr:hypothetical protein [bacterium]
WHANDLRRIHPLGRAFGKRKFPLPHMNPVWKRAVMAKETSTYNQMGGVRVLLRTQSRVLIQKRFSGSEQDWAVARGYLGQQPTH